MIYKAFMLNGSWEMDYAEEEYLSEKEPFGHLVTSVADPNAMSTNVVKNAVPGYWEDMTDAFAETSFFGKLKINPEYGIQRYPMADTPPDMALPNVVGNFFYRRRFSCDEVCPQTVIHFEGVQNSVSVWLNSVFLGRHSGFSSPFEIDIPDGLLKVGENTVVLSVSNHRLAGYEGEPVSGLTSRAANEFTGGITGDVELRTYNSPLRDLAAFVSEDCKWVKIEVELSDDAPVAWELRDGRTVLKSGVGEKEFFVDTEGLEFWSPENPKLYIISVSCENGVLERKVGIRRLLADGVHLSLNGFPYFLRGACEHCYFPETVHPNHSKIYYRSIIKKLKSLGFNFLRFHTYVPEEEYMQAADELGMMIQVECPNNTTVDEWKEIVRFCRRHPSVVIYCCGNELLMDDPFIVYLNECADYVHEQTDALFAPMSAMRGLEYFWCEPEQEKELCESPFRHHPRRFETVGGFSDLYCSYTSGAHSYGSLFGNHKVVDERSVVYKKPRLSHEICIDGTYADLSLESRYKGWRIGRTEMFSSIRKHLEKKGVIHKAPIYFKNSSEWQRRVRKYCFENLRLSQNIAGYDFLGPIDTHWHTFGYDVGMMNEFYELKPGESVRNVLMYNSETVLLNDLGKKVNFRAGEKFLCTILTSYYGREILKDAHLTVRLSVDGKVWTCERVQIPEIKNAKISELCCFSTDLPESDIPKTMKLFVSLDGGDVFAENEWELYLFPWNVVEKHNDLVISHGMNGEELIKHLENGENVILFGAEPFRCLPTSYRISLAGRTSGNLATVVSDHPALGKMPHDGFCGWQFANMLEGGSAVVFETEEVPFEPIVEVVSTHKYVIRQAALFEFSALNGKLLVCSFNFNDTDPGAAWLKAQLITYVSGSDFEPKYSIEKEQLLSLMSLQIRNAGANTNEAFNLNDKTAVRKNKRKIKV